jgi:hypothetical protein
MNMVMRWKPTLAATRFEMKLDEEESQELTVQNIF